MPVHRSVLLLVFAALGACGDDPPVAGEDAATPDTCAASSDCDDGRFCNGAESCDPDDLAADERGCVPAERPCEASQACDETMDACRTRCDVEVDADADGADAMECGGNDCDDADGDRFPGNIEVCDGASHDEDCDPSTYGDKDTDGDGSVDARCCNGETCGDDCDDLRREVSPGATEACDGFDNDCDESVDEGVLVDGFADIDRDLHGDPSAPMRACADAVRFAVVDDDCDDGNVAVHGGQPEICDGIDNDCDGVLDENPRAVTWYPDADGDGFGSAATGMATLSCAPVPAHSLLGTDCDDGRAGVSPGAIEACNGRDDDCNGVADYDLGENGFEDDDGDGRIDARCPGVGTDCDDEDPFAGEGTPELCDDDVDNDCDGRVDEDAGVPVLWYLDLDADGYGEESDSAVESCSRVAGRVWRGGDCDDSAPNRRPGLADLCDGVDEDCDGAIDEGSPRTAYYEDSDRDGVGAGEPVYACVEPPGHRPEGGDCDDDDDEVGSALPFYADNDGDGVGAGPPVQLACGSPSMGYASTPGDCDDMIASIGGCTDLPNASGMCVSGACVISSCAAGSGDCDGLTANGCEVGVMTDETQCGGCGMPACGIGARCVGGTCDRDIVDITLASNMGCALWSTGRVVCWGSCAGPSMEVPRVAMDGVEDGEKLSGGNGYAACVRRRAGPTMGWGYAYSEGATGHGVTGPLDPSPMLVADIASAAFGIHHGCGIRAGGTVVCFGTNGSGQLGQGDRDPRPLPSPVTGIANATHIDTTSHTCVRHSDGTVSCWGSGTSGELGNGAIVDNLRPVQVVGLDDALDVSVANYNTCSARSDGHVACWGWRAYGLVADGTDNLSGVESAPVDVAGLTDAVEVTLADDTACARRMSGGVVCWGSGSYGWGDGSPAAGSRRTTPGPIAGPADYEHIVAGSGTFCGLTTTDRVRCWGLASQYQTGNGNSATALAPVEVLNLD